MCNCADIAHPTEKCGGPLCHCHDPQTFEGELTKLINKYSQENPSGTPDYILADYIMACLKAYNGAVQARATWRGTTMELPSIVRLNMGRED